MKYECLMSNLKDKAKLNKKNSEKSCHIWWKGVGE